MFIQLVYVLIADSFYLHESATPKTREVGGEGGRQRIKAAELSESTLTRLL